MEWSPHYFELGPGHIGATCFQNIISSETDGERDENHRCGADVGRITGYLAYPVRRAVREWFFCLREKIDRLDVCVRRHHVFWLADAARLDCDTNELCWPGVVCTRPRRTTCGSFHLLQIPYDAGWDRSSRYA